MASQVLSGSSNVSYTNNTGQNVRIVINYMAIPTSMSWAGVTISSSSVLAIGRNLAFNVGASNTGISANNMLSAASSETTESAFPTEIMLASGQIFSANCNAYNVVIIPEAG
jgi:hypothetical protein